MAMTLIINGQALEQPEPYFTTEAQAVQARAKADARRSMARDLEARRTGAAPVVPMQRDALVFLEAAGRLRPQQRAAGQEILRVYTAISAGICGRTVASYGERVPSGPPAEDWAPTLRAAYTRRYCPWRDWAGTQPIRRGSWAKTCRANLGDLTMLVAVDGWCPEVVGRHYRMKPERVMERLAESLGWYADHAGWNRSQGVETAA